MQSKMNKIHNIDCLEFMKDLPENSIDMIITSPPYAEKRANVYETKKESDYNKWFIRIAQEVKRILKPSGSFFLNIKPHTADGERSLYVMKLVIAINEEVGMKYIDELCWTKTGFPGSLKGRFKNSFEPIHHFSNSGPGDITFNPIACGEAMKEESKKRAYRKFCGVSKNGSGMGGAAASETMKNVEIARPSNVIHAVNVVNQHSSHIKHPAVFPEKLVEFFIKSFSNKGDIIYDPFMGSGTTAKVAIEFGRNFIGTDLKADYIEVANKRIETVQGSLF